MLRVKPTVPETEYVRSKSAATRHVETGISPFPIMSELHDPSIINTNILIPTTPPGHLHDADRWDMICHSRPPSPAVQPLVRFNWRWGAT